MLRTLRFESDYSIHALTTAVPEPRQRDADENKLKVIKKFEQFKFIMRQVSDVKRTTVFATTNVL